MFYTCNILFFCSLKCWYVHLTYFPVLMLYFWDKFSLWKMKRFETLFSSQPINFVVEKKKIIIILLYYSCVIFSLLSLRVLYFPCYVEEVSLNSKLERIFKKKQKQKKQKQKKQQEVGDDLNVCVLNILPKASSLPGLFAINLTKVEI